MSTIPPTAECGGTGALPFDTHIVDGQPVGARVTVDPPNAPAIRKVELFRHGTGSMSRSTFSAWDSAIDALP